MPRQNEEEIQLGIQLFKEVCSNVLSHVKPGFPTIWAGSSCEGGGAYILHSMNEDSMTPYNVAIELGIKAILEPAYEVRRREVILQTMKFLGREPNQP